MLRNVALVSGFQFLKDFKISRSLTPVWQSFGPPCIYYMYACDVIVFLTLLVETNLYLYFPYSTTTHMHK